ncbi:MAG: MBL fold metallo-hydrolase [Corallococcus sp.]|nr:MBL fold metallo-hydrolase [Corallococcus sp.]MCM1359990.1 MBL fold metallo-hydrolase [Corallococcus sp.]MCM1395547.1 MBL fold metallo-hydrolase [Corallococcus sp.]
MKIQYLGHSCFRMISQMGTTIVTDPYAGDFVGFDMPRLSCDVVTISHRHRDHDYIKGVAGNPALLEKDVRLAADDVAIQSIFCHHDDQHGRLRGENYVFCFLVDGLKIVHMGDVGEVDDDLAKKIYGCDVLMLPVGGIYTVNAEQAKQYVDKVNPKIVLPMHYKTDKHKFDLDSLDKFTDLFDAASVRRLESETLVLDDLPGNVRPKVIVLNVYED